MCSPKYFVIYIVKFGFFSFRYMLRQLSQSSMQYVSYFERYTLSTRLKFVCSSGAGWRMLCFLYCNGNTELILCKISVLKSTKSGMDLGIVLKILPKKFIFLVQKLHNFSIVFRTVLGQLHSLWHSTQSQIFDTIRRLAAQVFVLAAQIWQQWVVLTSVEAFTSRQAAYLVWSRLGRLSTPVNRRTGDSRQMRPVYSKTVTESYGAAKQAPLKLV